MIEKDKITKNISEFHDVDGFKCARCGTEIIDYSRREIDEDTGEETHFEYSMKYCPECGRKVEDFNQISIVGNSDKVLNDVTDKQLINFISTGGRRITNGEKIKKVLEDIALNLEIEKYEMAFSEKYVRVTGRNDKEIKNVLPRTNECIFSCTFDFDWWNSEVE